jgi:hypothetical protein
MIVDSQLTFGTAFTLAATTGVNFGTNVIDLGSVRELAKGQPVYVDLFCTLAQTVTTGSITANLYSATVTAVTVGDTLDQTIMPVTVLGTSGAPSAYYAIGHVKRALITEDITNRYLSIGLLIGATCNTLATFAAYLTIGQDSD